MTIMVDGCPVLVKPFSRDGDMCLYTRSDTKAIDGYVYNIYSNHLSIFGYWQDGTIKFHKKLKVYQCESHGYYIVCQGRRMYVNGLVRGESKYAESCD